MKLLLWCFWVLFWCFPLLFPVCVCWLTSLFSPEASLPPRRWGWLFTPVSTAPIKTPWRVLRRLSSVPKSCLNLPLVTPRGSCILRRYLWIYFLWFLVILTNALFLLFFSSASSPEPSHHHQPSTPPSLDSPCCFTTHCYNKYHLQLAPLLDLFHHLHITEGSWHASNNSSINLPCLTGVPEDVMNPRFAHNIPKSCKQPNAYLESV